MPPKNSAQLSVSTRARRDPQRRVGTANVVATGSADLSRVSIISDRELDWIRRLANESEMSAQQDARAAEMQRRKQLSDSRKAIWPDTDGARQSEFLRRRQQEKDEAEARKVALDALFVQQNEQHCLEAMAKLELQNLKEDPRGRKVRSMLMLHDAIKSREQQIAFNKFLAEQADEDGQRELAEMQRKAWGEEAEEMRKLLEKRQRNLEEKDTNLLMVRYQIDERRRERADGVAERAHVEREAKDEAEENALEKAEMQRKELENGTYNLANSRKEVTKAQRLQKRIEEAIQDDAEREKEEAKFNSMKQFVLDARKRKEEQFERRKVAGMGAYLEELATLNSPTRRTQEHFVNRGVSFLERMYSGDADRVETMKGNGKRSAEEDNKYASYRKAQATASGFRSADEERAHLDEMREYPARVAAEEAAERAARRAEDERVRRIQEMQAKEKRENARRLALAEVEESRLQREQMEISDAQYRAYISAQIPDDMGEVLRERALELQ